MIPSALSSRRVTRWVLPPLTALATVGMFSGSNEPILPVVEGTWIAKVAYALHTGNTIIFNLSVGYLVGLFVWFLVAWIPEARKRAILRNNLARQYQHFKEDVICILLFAAVGTYDSELPKQLCDYKEFKKFFGDNNNENWYAALNGLQGDEGYLNDLVVEIELLANEISYVLNNLSIDDDDVHAFFKRLSTHVYRLKNSSVYTSDHVKYLGNFLWEILARWSFIDGQRREDIVQEMIEKV